MRRAGEDRARAVVHQHEVRDIDRQRLSLDEGMARLEPGVEAHLVGRLDRFFRGTDAVAFADEVLQSGIVRREYLRQRVMRRERAEARAVERVGPRREDFELAVVARRVLEFEEDARAFRTADPVLLHQPDLFRPALQRVEAFEEFVGEVGDLQEPLRQLTPLDGGARAPATAVDHLLVREHGVVDRVPVHHALLAADETRVEHVEEERLFVAVIFGVAGRELAGPVDGEADGLELLAHRRDVVVGPALRMDVLLHRRVFGRHAEGVPAHRVKHVETARLPVARDHVAHGVIADMTHVDAPRRIGEHLQNIIFGPAVSAVAGQEVAALFPELLPFRLDRTGIVSCGHCRSVASRGREAPFEGNRQSGLTFVPSPRSC